MLNLFLPPLYTVYVIVEGNVKGKLSWPQATNHFLLFSPIAQGYFEVSSVLFLVHCW